MAGIGGFAEGFSGGLGQGMGIIQNVRADKRAEAEQAKRFTQIDQQMKLADKADLRADAGEARAGEVHADTMETSRYNKKELRPLQLKQAQLAVDKYEQDIKIGGVEYAAKELSLKYLPQQLQLGIDHTREQIRSSKADDNRADRSLDFQIAQGRQSMDLALRGDARQQEAHSLQVAGTLLPIYTSMIEKGLPVPPSMTKMIASTPFGLTQHMELARASDDFPKIMESAGKGDFSFMKNGDMAESAMSLARPIGMNMARTRGFDASSARVLNIMPNGEKGGVKMQITARDPKSGRYTTFWQFVPGGAEKLAGEMEKSARSGWALKNHPSYTSLMQNMPNYASVFKGDVRAEAGKAWDEEFDNMNKLLETDPENAQAKRWMQLNADKATYVERIVGGSRRAQNSRGDAYGGDWNAVSSTVSRFTGLTDPAEVSKRANAVLDVMGKMGGVDQRKIPNVMKALRPIAEKAGGWKSNPAAQIAGYYAIQSNPALLKELYAGISGGQGAGNPSRAGPSPRYAPDFNPIAEMKQQFGIAPTSGLRTAKHQASLRAQGLTTTQHSTHQDGDGIDFPTPKGMSKLDFIGAIKRKYPFARTAPSNGNAVHVTFPGWGGAPDVSGSRARFG
jgi:hypothetical protein